MPYLYPINGKMTFKRFLVAILFYTLWPIVIVADKLIFK